MNTLGLIFITIAIVFSAAETIYFGCNWSPVKQAEVICDGISLLFCVAGLMLMWMGK